MGPSLRRYRPGDAPALASLWRSSQLATVRFRAAATHTPEEYLAHLRDHVAKTCELWVAEECGAPVGFMAVRGDLLEHLYVDPDAQGRGVGSALLARAHERAAAPLRLFTLQQNRSARAFYERRGFRPARFAVSPPPENEPDVEYVYDAQSMIAE